MSRLSQIRVAGMMMTRLPLGRIEDPPPLAACAWAFPLWGAAPACLAWPLFAATGGPLGAALALLAAVLVTGALHHDGLADFADGIGGGRDRAHALAIMRDSRIGSYGVLALVFAVTLPVLALPRAAPGPGEFLLLGIASRLAMLVATNRLPPARGDGLGRLAAGRASLLPGGVAVALLAVWIGAAALGALLAGGAAATLVARSARRRIGGQTGDVLGAIQVSFEVTGWVALAWLAG